VRRASRLQPTRPIRTSPVSIATDAHHQHRHQSNHLHSQSSVLKRRWDPAACICLPSTHHCISICIAHPSSSWPSAKTTPPSRPWPAARIASVARARCPRPVVRIVGPIAQRRPVALCSTIAHSSPQPDCESISSPLDPAFAGSVCRFCAESSSRLSWPLQRRWHHAISHGHLSVLSIRSRAHERTSNQRSARPTPHIEPCSAGQSLGPSDLSRCSRSTQV